MWRTKGSYWVTQVRIDDAWNQGLRGENSGRHSHLPMGRSPFLQKLSVKALWKTVCLQTLANHHIKLNFKGLKVLGFLFLAKQGPKWLGPFLQVTWHEAFTSWANKNSCLSFQREDRSHFWQWGPSHLSPLAAPLAFSCLSSPSSLPLPPFLQSEDRRADRWTQDIRTQERGGWKECREQGKEGEEGEKGGLGKRVARREGITTVFARYKAFGCWIPGMGDDEVVVGGEGWDGEGVQARVRQHLAGIIGSRMGGSWGALLCSGVMFFLFWQVARLEAWSGCWGNRAFPKHLHTQTKTSGLLKGI